MLYDLYLFSLLHSFITEIRRDWAAKREKHNLMECCKIWTISRLAPRITNLTVLSPRFGDNTSCKNPMLLIITLTKISYEPHVRIFIDFFDKTTLLISLYMRSLVGRHS